MESRILQLISALRASGMRVSKLLIAIDFILIFFVQACSPSQAIIPTATAADTNTPAPTPTGTPIPTATKIILNVGPDVQKALENQNVLNPDGSLVDKLAHSEAGTIVAISDESIRLLAANNTAVGYLVVGEDVAGLRYLWNVEIGSWAPEYQFTQTYEESETVELSAVYDGSLKLSALLFYAENPGIIPETAAQVHYMVNMQQGDILISPFRYNQHQWPDALDPTRHTIITDETVDQARTWGWLGFIKTFDEQGNEISLLSQVLLNPTESSQKNLLPIFGGLTKEVYEQYANAIGSDGLNVWERMMKTNNLQLVIAFPYPEDYAESENAEGNRVLANPSMPAVARLLQGRDILSIFSPAVREQIKSTYASYEAASNKFSSPEQPFSFPIGELPDGLSKMVIYPGFTDFLR